MYVESKIGELVEAESRRVVARGAGVVEGWWSRATKFMVQDEYWRYNVQHGDYK